MGHSSKSKARLDHYLCNSRLISTDDLGKVHTYARRRKLIHSLPMLLTISVLNAVFMVVFVTIAPPPADVTSMMLVWGWVCSIPITLTFVALAKRPRRQKAHWVKG